MNLKERLKNPYIILTIIYAYYIVFAFIVNTPMEIFDGLRAIMLAQDVLVTDYVEIAGIGATLVNSALVSLIVLAFLAYNKVKLGGSIIMAFWLLSGFAFFGKSLFNVWPVMLGVYLYSRFRKEHFSKFTAVMLLSTAMSPTVSQVLFEESLSFPIAFAAAIFVGVAIGFIAAPIAENAMLSHHGYNLYHIGFTAGLIAIIMRTVLTGFGFDIAPVYYWHTDSMITLAIFLSGIFLFMIAVGLYCGENNKKNMSSLMSRTGRLASDYYGDYGESSYINMGALGFLGMIVSIVVSGNINGPIMGGILTMAGFGAFGKHLKNAAPIMIGLLLGFIFVNFIAPNEAAILAVLFGTCLSPIAGSFGWKWGIATGFLHMLVATGITEAHGGMNLYSNGLAGGLVVMFLIPLILAFTRASEK